jgi:uncharacterized protein with ParB-like and HNH nuclease domain
MGNNFLETKTITLGELLGNGKTYMVPPYQRDYSWNEDKWEDLFFDINDLENSKHPHYMGAIVLQTSNNKQYSIIDGQQRITTLSIFIIAIISILKDMVTNNIDKEANEERVEILSRTYLGDKNPASLHRVSKLELNAVNNPFFTKYVVQILKPARAVLIKEDSANKQLLKAYEYFYKRLKEKLKGLEGEKVTKYLSETIADKIKFIQIAVEDELNAYTLFETLNARGVELTSSDLLKNYLFSLVGDGTTKTGDYKVLLEEWNYINSQIGTKDFPNFLRYYINSQKPLVRHNGLYKEIKKSVNNHEDVFTLIDNLKELAPVYMAFKNPSDDLWGEYGNYKELKLRLNELKLFKVSQQIPLLLSVYKEFEDKEFIKVLKICSIISFRYSAIGRLNPNEMERIYNKCSIKVSSKEIITAKEVFDNLKNIYVDDEAFENSFSSASIDTGRNRKLVKYILINIENQLDNKEYDFDESGSTIEHILPTNPENDSLWYENFSIEEMEKLTSRLGNYILLENNINKKIGNDTFGNKIIKYKDSSYKIANDFKFEEWNPEKLKQHQKDFAKLAKSIWKISY